MLHQDPVSSGWYRPSAEMVDPSFRIIQNLADDLSGGEVSFPTSITATLKIRRVLNDPQVNAERIARAISAEPLLASKVVQAANSATPEKPRKPVADIRGAVLRLGLSRVHSIATEVATAQLVVAKEMQPFLKRAEAVWRHSIDVAAIAYVLARELTRVNPDEALFAGLVHDVGRFYLLSRAPKYPELTADLLVLETVLDEWHASIGHAVLSTFGLPEAVLYAVADHESCRIPSIPKTLSEIVIVANLSSKGPNPLSPGDSGTQWNGAVANPEICELLQSSAEELKALAATLRG